MEASAKMTKKDQYTYKDYLSWPKEERWELIEGVPYMQAAPSWQHQAISAELSRQFANHLINTPCKVFTAPFDVRLPHGNESDEDTKNVVQPDIVVVCDKSGLRGTGYYGIPPLLIEIVSPSSGRMDRLKKFNKYEQVGVKEYWIVEPDAKIISVFVLGDDNRYGRPEIYSDEYTITVSTFDEITIDLKTVFDF
jgi:Uma2 family endonuclease